MKSKTYNKYSKKNSKRRSNKYSKRRSKLQKGGNDCLFQSKLIAGDNETKIQLDFTDNELVITFSGGKSFNLSYDKLDYKVIKDRIFSVGHIDILKTKRINILPKSTDFIKVLKCFSNKVKPQKILCESLEMIMKKKPEPGLTSSIGLSKAQIRTFIIDENHNIIYKDSSNEVKGIILFDDMYKIEQPCVITDEGINIVTPERVYELSLSCPGCTQDPIIIKRFCECINTFVRIKKMITKINDIIKKHKEIDNKIEVINKSNTKNKENENKYHQLAKKWKQNDRDKAIEFLKRKKVFSNKIESNNERKQLLINNNDKLKEVIRKYKKELLDIKKIIN